MIIIRRVRLHEITLPLREPFRISSGVVAERRIILAELEDADGVVAWGECVAGELPNYSAETTGTAWLALTEWLVPRLLASALDHPRDCHDTLFHDIRGHRMAGAALEMAVWTLASIRGDVPLARLLGGTRDHVEVGVSLGIQPDIDALLERVRAARAAGYRRIKLKIMPGRDLDEVRAVRSELGPEFPLSVDANSAYDDASADRLRALDELGLLMIEQPLHHADLAFHAALQRELSTAICLDESITGSHRAREMLRLGSGRIVNIKPGRVGGFTESLRIHDACMAADVPVWCGGMLESGVGRGCNVALASLPGFTLPGDISPSARYWERDIVHPEWTMEGGLVAVPQSAGTGVSIDRDYVDERTARSVDLSA